MTYIQRDITDPRVNLDLVQAGAEQVIQRLRNLIASVGPADIYSHFYTKMRVKTIDSITKKIDAQQRGGYGGPNPNFSFRDITDYAGVRFITLYDEDLKYVFDFIIEFVKSAENITDPIFFHRGAWTESFREAYFIPRQNTPAGETELYTFCHKQFVGNLYNSIKKDKTYPQNNFRIADFKRLCKVQPRNNSSYSSAHILFFANSYIGGEIIPVPIEIQVRTAVEDIWSEISHGRIYKVSSDNIWTSQFDAAHRRATARSDSVKADLESVQNAVRGISDLSVFASKEITEFWDRRDPLRASPHRDGQVSRLVNVSLCISLYYHIGENRDAGVIDLIAGYGKAISALCDGSASQEVAYQAFLDAVGLLDQLIATSHNLSATYSRQVSEWRRKQTRPSGVLQDTVHSLSADIELENQRAKLCELEKIRLYTFLFLANEFHVFYSTYYKHCNFSVLDGGANPTFYSAAMDLYRRFCKFVDDPNLRVRPLCMIYYWKHLLMLPHNEILASRNISLSSHVLDNDQTVPPWSIYRSLVPRGMAVHLLDRAGAKLAAFAPGEIEESEMLSLRLEIKEECVQAILYSSESKRELSDDEDMRGDIHLVIEDDQRQRDEFNIVQICYFYREYFHEEIFADRDYIKKS